LADYIYENNGTFDNLKSQIQVIWKMFHVR
jgi:dephospho-CoA kinase